MIIQAQWVPVDKIGWENGAHSIRPPEHFDDLALFGATRDYYFLNPSGPVNLRVRQGPGREVVLIGKEDHLQRKV